jgi:hypothetical protein
VQGLVKTDRKFLELNATLLQVYKLSLPQQKQMAHLHTHSKTASRWEKLGFSLSVLCTIHCLAMPFVIMSLPFLGMEFLNDPLLEGGLIGASFVLAGITLFRDYRRYHNKRLALLLLLMAVCVVGGAHIIPNHSETILSASGGMLVFAAYAANWQLSRKHHSCAVHTPVAE